MRGEKKRKLNEANLDFEFLKPANKRFGNSLTYKFEDFDDFIVIEKEGFETNPYLARLLVGQTMYPISKLPSLTQS